jgi:hypothetical protein
MPLPRVPKNSPKLFTRNFWDKGQHPKRSEFFGFSQKRTQGRVIGPWCPRRESNPHLILRTDLLYPLSYEGKKLVKAYKL